MVRQPCDSGTCQDTAHGPVCSESNTAVRECLTPPHELVASADTVCWQNAVTHCADGFPYDSAACAAGACVDTVACGAVCVSSPVPDHPACTVPGMKQLCVDDVFVQCGCGRHEPKETTCNDVCVNVAADVDPAEGFCALAAAIDERCPDIRGGNVDNAYCDGDIKVSCHRQRDIARTPCPGCRPDAMSGVLCGG